MNMRICSLVSSPGGGCARGLRSLATASVLVAFFSGSPPPADAQTVVAIPERAAPPGSEIAVPVSLTGGEGVTALQLDVLFDPSVLEARTPEAPVSLAPHLLATSEPSTGRLRILVLPPVTDPLPDLSSGQVVTLRFGIAPDAGPQRSTLRIADATLSDSSAGAVTASTMDGAVTVVPADVITEVPTLDGMALGLLAVLLGAAACLRLAS